MVGILIGGMHEQAGDVRYLSAMALGSAPVAHQKRVEKELNASADDRNLRVQAAAAEALSRYELRIYQTRHALSAQYVSSFGSPDAGAGKARSSVEERPSWQAPSPDEAAEETGTSDGQEEQAHDGQPQSVLELKGQEQKELAMSTAPGDDFGGSAGESRVRSSMPPIAGIAQSIERKPTPEGYDDPDEGLRPLREVQASIRLPTGEEPADYAAARMAGEPGVFHPLGMTRGWGSTSYGWDAPANYYKPVYFEDVNLERYGIHCGLGSPLISFAKFFGCFPFLPYKMVVQPPCECHYTLGFERPNNCVPVHCFGWGLPKMSLLWWCSCHNYCPIRPACPWTCDERCCNDGWETYCESDGEMVEE
jgi:hypothetical protein